MTEVSKQRLVYIDTAKGVGMSMIVWMHIWGNNSYGFTSPLLLNSLISTIYVPIFFVLSGFLQSIRNIDLRGVLLIHKFECKPFRKSRSFGISRPS